MAAMACRCALWLVAALLITGAARAETWFAPSQPRPDVAARLRSNGENPGFLRRLDAAQADWKAFFQPAMLDRLAPLMQVYAIGTGPVIGIPDVELKAGLDALAMRHVRIALVTQPVIVPEGECGKTEGYDDLHTLTAAVAKLKRLGIQPSVLALDGGLWFGHFATGPQECRYSLDQTIAAVAVTVRTVATTFPGITVGDVEPAVALTRQPGWQAALRSYRAGLQSSAGQPLSFLELDVAWENPAWRDAVREQAALARGMGLRLGVILNGDGTDRSDAEWLAHARDNLAELEGGLGMQPDFVSVASWNPYPARSVGPDLDTTLASLLVQDAQPGVRLSASPGSDRVTGRLTDMAGRPLPGHRVVLSALTSAIGGRLPITTMSGVVPNGAVSAIVGLRVNSECECAGPDDMLIGGVTFTEKPSGHPALETPVRLIAALHRASGASLRYQGEGATEVARVTASSTQALMANAAPIAVTPGSAFSVSVAAGDLLQTAVYGAVTVIWISQGGHGVSRDDMILRPEYHNIVTAITDANGAFVARVEGTAKPFRLTASPDGPYRGALLFSSDMPVR